MDIWYKEISKEDYFQKVKKTIKGIDVSLDLIEVFSNSSTLVCLVKKENLKYILKLADYNSEKSGFDWQFNHIEREKIVLDAARGVNGLTHLIKSYHNLANPILKEFFEGSSLSELGKKISETRLQKKVEGTVRNLHRLNFAGLDLGKRNIVLSPEEEDAQIIDIGGAYTKKEIGRERYEKLKNNDLKNLEYFVFEK